MREIELRPIKGERGGREIIVDGVQWGSVTCHGHGCHGYGYQFRQTFENGEDRIRREIYKGCWKPIAFRPVKPSRYDRAIHGDKGTPLDEQLLVFVRGLIANGELRDPKIIEVERAAAEDAFHRNQIAAAEREAHEFRERAGSCLKPILVNITVSDHTHADMISEIIKAMRWAQTR